MSEAPTAAKYAVIDTDTREVQYVLSYRGNMRSIPKDHVIVSNEAAVHIANIRNAGKKAVLSESGSVSELTEDKE